LLDLLVNARDQKSGLLEIRKSKVAHCCVAHAFLPIVCYLSYYFGLIVSGRPHAPKQKARQRSLSFKRAQAAFKT
jgi:hypothetical protein